MHQESQLWDDLRISSAEEQIPSLCTTTLDKDKGIFWMFFTYLFNLLQPLFVGCKFCHECLMLQPLAVQVPRLIIGHILGCEHLLIDPEGELERKIHEGVRKKYFPTFSWWEIMQNAFRSRIKRCLYRRAV